jgi:anti-anti-sigma factor
MRNLPEVADSTYSGVGVKLVGKDESTLTLALRGKMIATTIEDLARRVLGMCSREGWRPEIVLDFGKVAQIDSMGIGAICEIHSQVTNQGGQLRIAHASPSVLKVMRLMSMDSFIDFD